MGWLGWSPEVAWSTPIPELLMALDARMEYVRLTNPFGGGGGGGKAAPKAKPSANTVAEKLRAALTGRKREA